MPKTEYSYVCPVCKKSFTSESKKRQFCSRPCFYSMHPGMPPRSPEKRFWQLVNKTEACWVWTGHIQFGYGAFWNGKKPVRAHRFSYELANGPIENKDLLVCHKCDNPACVRPDHLFLGTDQDNADDMVQKGRSAKGERSSAAKLKESQVLAIRDDPRKFRVIAMEYKIDHKTVSCIKKRLSWKHLP